MEAVADLIRSGRVTQDNIYANTWLKKAACAGKSPKDPEALQNLKEYIVSRANEEEVLKQTIEDKDYSRGRNERLLEELNNGAWMEKIKKDTTFRDVMAQNGDKPIDPDKIFAAYRILSMEREMQRNHPLARLRAEREALIRDFGVKPIAQASLKEVTQLLMLDSSIKEGMRELPEETDKINDDQSKKYRKALASVYKNRDLDENMTPARRKAMQQVSADPKNAGKAFTLDQIVEMVNEAEKRIPQQKQAEPEQVALPS